MSCQIFVSHAVKDKALADALVELIRLDLDIASRDVFCSSLEGHGIPSGTNFVDHIKKQIQEPKVVIVLLTENYLASQFCLCELGAAWAMSHRMLPLLVPPLKYADVKGVLTGVQVTAINNTDQLSQFRDDLILALECSSGSTAKWESKKQQFLGRLDSILAAITKPVVVTPAEHSALKVELEDAQSYIEELESERTGHLEQIESLAKAKDKEEVKRIRRAHVPQLKQLGAALASLKTALKKLPGSVSLVAYKELGLQRAVHLDRMKDQEFCQQAETDREHQLITIDDETGECKLNIGNQRVAAMRTELFALQDFLSKAPVELFDSFEEEHGVHPDLANRSFWQDHLDDRIRLYGA